ncbi:MAG: alpha/beta hydrolase [Polyangiales bacterium]
MLGFDLYGSGEHRIIVLNDWLCDTSTWDAARPYLDPATFTWAFADLRGYGRSRALRGACTVEEAAGDVLALADELHWTRFSIVGHSMSTLVAAHLAQTAPDRVTSAVLLTPPPPSSFGYDPKTHAALKVIALGDDAGRTKALEVMLGGRLSAGWRKFKIDRWRATSEPAMVAGYLAMFGVRGLPDRSTAITRPVLALTGEEDAPPMRRASVEQLFAPLCAKLELASIVESGHYPMQECPPRLVALVEDFLRRNSDR